MEGLPAEGVTIKRGQTLPGSKTESETAEKGQYLRAGGEKITSLQAQTITLLTVHTSKTVCGLCTHLGKAYTGISSYEKVSVFYPCRE